MSRWPEPGDKTNVYYGPWVIGGWIESADKESGRIVVTVHDPATAPLPIANQMGKVGKTAPSTARKAAINNLPRSGSQRARVLVRILNAGSDGLTDDELSDTLGLDKNTIRPRRLELVEGGWVEDSWNKRQTSKGNEAIVWVPSGKARLMRSAQRI